MAPADLATQDLSEYQKRTQAFSAGKAELEQNLVVVDRCCQELWETVEMLISQLTQYRDHWIGQLQAWKATLSADIDQAVSEVQASLAQEDVRLQTKYAAALRGHQPGNLVLFAYAISASSLQMCIQSILSTAFPQPKQPSKQPEPELPPLMRQLTSPLVRPLPPQINRMNSLPQQSSKPAARLESSANTVQPQLAYLTCEQLRFFDFRKNSWKPASPLEKPIKCDNYTSYILVEDKRLFCCGNMSAGHARNAYMLHLDKESQVSVEDLPPMTHQRGNPGLLCFEESVLVFGSGWLPGTSVEVLSTGVWTLLSAQMSCKRYGFTPCVFEKRGYLYDSFLPASIDVFDLGTRSFMAPLTVRLPPEGYGNVCVVNEDKMTVVSGQHTIKISLRDGATQAFEHDRKEIWPVSTPVVWGKWVYWVRKDGKCVRASGKLLEEF